MEVLTVAAASAAITKIVDAIRNLVGVKDKGKDDDKQLEPKVPKIVWNAAALALGVIGAFVFEIEPVDLAGIEADGAALKVLTGMVAGGLASGWHEVFSAVSSVQKKNQKLAGQEPT